MSIFSYPPIIYIRFIISILTPVAYFLLFVLGYKLASLAKLCKFKIHATYAAAIFIILYSQPNLVNQCISLLSCREILGLKYISADVSYLCYSVEHILFMLILVLPATFLWFFFLPGYIFWQIYKNRKHLENAMFIYKFGFLFQEYKKEIYYWEYVKMYQRLLFVVILNFFEAYVKEKSILVCLSLLGYLLILFFSRPYKNDNLNKVDGISTIICLITILFGVFIYNNPIFWMVLLCYLILFVLNGVFILFTISKIFFSFTVDFNDKLQLILPFLSKFSPKLVKLLKIRKSTESGKRLWRVARYAVSKYLKKRQLSKQQSLEAKNTEFVNYKSEEIEFEFQDNHLLMNEDNSIENPSKSILMQNKVVPKKHIAKSSYIPDFMNSQIKNGNKDFEDSNLR